MTVSVEVQERNLSTFTMPSKRSCAYEIYDVPLRMRHCRDFRNMVDLNYEK